MQQKKISPLPETLKNAQNHIVSILRKQQFTTSLPSVPTSVISFPFIIMFLWPRVFSKAKNKYRIKYKTANIKIQQQHNKLKRSLQQLRENHKR